MAVMISSFVALTLTPVMCSLMLGDVSRTKSTKWSDRSFDAFFRGLNRAYAATLRFVMRKPAIM